MRLNALKAQSDQVKGGSRAEHIRSIRYRSVKASTHRGCSAPWDPMANTAPKTQTCTRLHGYARYKLDACRCYECAWANSVYTERRTRLIAYGRWKPWTRIGLARLYTCGA